VKIVLVVPDGVGIRNFLYTRFLDLLAAQAEGTELVAWHVLPEHVLTSQEGRPVRFEPLPYVREGLAARVLRQAKIYAQLHWRYEEDAADVMLRGRRPSGGALSRVIGGAAHLLGRLVPTPDGAAWLDRCHAAAASGDGDLAPFEAFLRRERPDVVFCTHQRASRAVPALLAARRLGIPTATFIYSWDNLPKGRMAVHADRFLVWSEAMKAELLLYYPEMDPERVRVVGTPQFEPHLEPALARPREELLGTLGLDPARPVVCFSGDDEMTSPCDPVYLEDLAAALRKLPEPPQLLFRRAPTDVSGRYAGVLARFPEIAVCDPAWRAGEGDWTQVAPLPGDLGLLANVARHCDVVVNLGSTMGMDFAVFDKPAVYIAYNPACNPPNLVRRDIMDVYRLPHFRCVHALQPVYWARSADDLGEQVRRALEHPGEKSEARARWLRQTVAFPLDRASERCAAALMEMVR
jgi:hypothetical protein